MKPSDQPSRRIRSIIREDLKAVHDDFSRQVYLEMDSDPNPVGFRRAREKAMLACIASGDTTRIETYLLPGIEATGRDSSIPIRNLPDIWEDFAVGILSERPLQQMLYLFISSITLCTRAAIDGGLPENIAYALSDCYIRQGSQISDYSRLGLLSSYAIYDFTRAVAEEHLKGTSPLTRLCCEYIQRHLHDRITLKDLAEVCGRSPNYISDLFTREMGERPTVFIRRRKLEYARGVLEFSDFSIEAISDLLAFPSVSSFIASFKKAYGVTPGKYKKNQ